MEPRVENPVFFWGLAVVSSFAVSNSHPLRLPLTSRLEGGNSTGSEWVVKGKGQMGSRSGLNKARKGLWQKGLRCIGGSHSHIIWTWAGNRQKQGKQAVPVYTDSRIGLICW